MGQVGNGLPDNGQFIDASTGGIVQLLPYTGNNVLMLDAATTTGTLTLAAPAHYGALSLLISSYEHAGGFKRSEQEVKG